MTPRCPSELEIARAVHDDRTGIEAHLASCARCRSSRDAFKYAIVLARQLPLELPPDDELARMRAAVVAKGSAMGMSTSGELAPPVDHRVARRAPIGRVVTLGFVVVVAAGLGAAWVAWL